MQQHTSFIISVTDPYTTMFRNFSPFSEIFRNIYLSYIKTIIVQYCSVIFFKTIVLRYCLLPSSYFYSSLNDVLIPAFLTCILLLSLSLLVYIFQFPIKENSNILHLQFLLCIGCRKKMGKKRIQKLNAKLLFLLIFFFKS